MNEEPQPKRRRGRPTAQITLSDDERQTLQRWARRHRSSQALALRCRIVLACAQGLSTVAVGEHLGVHPATVAKWRRRFATRRLEGLGDEPRPGVPRTITDEQVEQVIVTTLEEAPADATHWHHQPVRGAEPGLGPGHLADDPAPPGDRVPAVPGPCRPGGPRLVGRARDLRGLLHPQDPGDPALAGRPPPLPRALHADL